MLRFRRDCTLASILGRSDIDGLLHEVAARESSSTELLFLPYLAGERTPHNDANARGVFMGLDQTTTAADMTRAVLEGVAYSIREARKVLAAAGSPIDSVGVAGGGTRNAFWLQIISDLSGLTLSRISGTELGPAFGAARLARIALTGEAVEAICTKPPVADRFVPDPSRAPEWAANFKRYGDLYTALRSEFQRPPGLQMPACTDDYA